MARLRWNTKLIATIGIIVVVSLVAWMGHRFVSAREQVVESEALREAHDFLLLNAVTGDADARFYQPLSPEQQVEFDRRFRDGRGAPFFYDPYDANGNPIRVGDDTSKAIVVYSLSRSGNGGRAVLLSSGTFDHVSDEQIEWATRQLARRP
jgi:hypothetical protein